MAPARRSKRRWRAALIVLLAAVLCSAAFSPAAVAENNGSAGAHVHTSACKRQTGALACPYLDARLSGSAAATAQNDDGARVETVTSLIDSLPAEEEAEAALSALPSKEQAAYRRTLSARVSLVYSYYEDLGKALQSRVSNSEKLLPLLYLCPVNTQAVSAKLTVYQVNQYTLSETALAYSGKSGVTVGSALNGGMSYTYWQAIVVENKNGTLQVSALHTDQTPKKDIRIPQNGFVLLTRQAVSVSVGNYVTADFDYTAKASNANGLGSVSFSSAAPVKAEKDNSGSLTVVPGADTRSLIEVNLYDYNEKVNARYNRDHNYPGFQQDNGQITVNNTYDSNFGNNITKDLSAGQYPVTKKDGGNINATVDAGAGLANSPIAGAMQPTLSQDGYPVLSNGIKLDYLWKNSDCAQKQNTQSINGLFRYHEDTGAYTFNSRENHAQFNKTDDTFTLYRQILTANFLWYPFGNFLPFNDIVHQSAQVSKIDRAYLQSIAATALQKYNNGRGKAYQTLSSSLTAWIAKMDSKYPAGWSSADAMNEYFNTHPYGPGKKTGQTFDFHTQSALLQNLYSLDFDDPTDFYFGMEMKMNFMQPKQGLTGKDGKHPMVFEFYGDDDVWVYIDGKLALDLSGIHRHVGGKIDFTTGKIYTQSLNVATGEVGGYTEQTSFRRLGLAVDQNGRLKDYSTHSFHFYYMERGAGSGVCRMNFNFPLLKKNTLSVTKKLTADDTASALLGNPDFRFQALCEDGKTLFIGADTPYKLLNDAGETLGQGKTDANGVFTLKAGQTAQFSGIPENAGKYFVRELLDPDFFAQYGSITVSGEVQTTGYDVTVGTARFTGVNSPVQDMADGATAFLFENRADSQKLSSLSIGKTYSAHTAPAKDAFAFAVSLDGAPLPKNTPYTVNGQTRRTETEGLVRLAPGETAVFSNLLAGTRYTVEETADSAEGYVVSYTVNGEKAEGPVSGTLGLAESVSISVDNGEEGASVAIPVRKVLLSPDGHKHAYTLSLQQVSDRTGQTPAPSGYTATLPIEITDDPVTGAFTLFYPKKELSSLPGVFYYKISEHIVQDDAETKYDPAVYIVEITVAYENDALLARVSAVWKDGKALTDLSGEPAVCFTNQRLYAVLPETGGQGTGVYTALGALTVFLAAGLWAVSKPRKRGDARP